MSFFSNTIKIKLMKIATFSTVALMIAACTQTNPARVNDISHSPSAVTGSNTRYAQHPTGISSNPQTKPSSTTATVTSVNATANSATRNDTITTQEKIIYSRNYDDMPKGGYKGESYTVQRGDTLFYIAWISGNDFRALAAKNNIKEPYDLSVGQVIDVSGGTTVVVTEKTVTAGTATSKPTTVTTTTATSTSATKPNAVVTNTTTTTTTGTPSVNATPTNIKWQWPAKGKVVEGFSNATKGIDISGSLGDKVKAAAAGRVVYAGNALPGYGNLIIVKHNDDYLTAYAHNQSILVKEQQDVKAGQQLATMGSTGTSSVRLHFEIRYKAKSVDPMKYLPK